MLLRLLMKTSGWSLSMLKSSQYSELLLPKSSYRAIFNSAPQCHGL
jgi:hypothetical protein